MKEMHILLPLFLEVIIIVLDVQYVSSTFEHAIVNFDSKNITLIGNRSEDPSLNKSDNANDILQDFDLSLCWIYLAH